MRTTELRRRKIVLAVTGASGAVYSLKLLEKLQQLKSPPEEIAVIFSDTAREIWEAETGQKYIAAFPAKEYGNKSFLCSIRFRFFPV